MAYQFTFTERFQKHYKTLTQNEKKQLMRKLELLAEYPMHPSLRTKKIQGTSDLYECSVNMDIRIVWYYEGDKLIILVDVGHHDILKQF
ncbi:MAG: type II toxin-antitoxin system mRNA interferase toxin, RelE/StbE family [Clostridiales bacterium]|jgi:addiction module RelE/StbE family toxin|nr:type II toxin-antitoxin system mRNA interferase toxin, RelE/StbE family [Clostridiales bacterium]